MFYNVLTEGHGLPHDPFKAIVAPRPIGWISTVDEQGVPNLAPYSFFNAVSDRPHIVMFSSDGKKDTLSNMEKSGEFICNIATYDLREQMNMTSAPVDSVVSEFDLAGLTMVRGELVKAHRVKESPIALECKYLKTVELEDVEKLPSRYKMALGQVVGIHISEEVLTDGLLDMKKLNPLGRLGYHDYAYVAESFSMQRPTA